MQILFRSQDPETVYQALEDNLANRELGKLIQLELSDKDLRVEVNKLGTSSLEFQYKLDGAGFIWELRREKIAFSHRAFKSDILAKIGALVDQIGGSIVP